VLVCRSNCCGGRYETAPPHFPAPGGRRPHVLCGRKPIRRGRCA
jgi:hypothetical protein